MMSLWYWLIIKKMLQTVFVPHDGVVIPDFVVDFGADFAPVLLIS